MLITATIITTVIGAFIGTLLAEGLLVGWWFLNRRR